MSTRLVLLGAAVLLLTGCVTIPWPPTGPEAGRYGVVTIGYRPAASPGPLPSSTK